MSLSFDTKQKKVAFIVAIVLLSIILLGGIATGIYFAVTVVPYEGVVLDSATNAGIEGVTVTDGKNFTKTDKSGHYRLKGWHKSTFVSVTIPSKYWTEDYYIHKGDAQNGDYNFSLDPKDEAVVRQEEEYHTFIQVADLEVGENGIKDNWIDELKEMIAEEKPAFIMHTGDICYEAGLISSVEKLNTENMGVPVRYAIGNHDYVKSDGLYGESMFESIYGPTMYSFDVGKVHYVVLPFGQGADRLPRYGNADINRFLVNDLAEVSDDMSVVVLCHEKAKDEETYQVQSGGKTVDLFEENVIAWVFGHWHYNMLNVAKNDKGDQILHIGTSSPFGGIDSSVGCFRRINLKGNAVDSTNTHYLYLDGANETVDSDAGTEWQTKLDGRVLYSEAIVEGDRIYVGTVDEDYPRAGSFVYCLDKNTGDIIWQQKVSNSVKNVMAYSDGKLIVQDAEGKVYCMDTAAGGDILWETQLKFDNISYTAQGLCVDGGYVYAGNSHTTAKIDITNGKVVWESKSDGENSPNKIIVAGDLVIVGANWRALIAYNKESGDKVWEIRDGRNTTCTALAVGDYLYVGANSKLEKINLKTGEILISNYYDNSGKVTDDYDKAAYSFNPAGTLTYSDGIIYAPTDTNGILAVNADTLETVWTYTEIGGSLIGSAPYQNPGAISVVSTLVVEGDYLIFGAADGKLYSLNKNTGKMVDTFAINAPILTKVAVSDGKVIVADFAGRITSIRLGVDGKFVKADN